MGANPKKRNPNLVAEWAGLVLVGDGIMGKEVGGGGLCRESTLDLVAELAVAEWAGLILVGGNVMGKARDGGLCR